MEIYQTEYSAGDRLTLSFNGLTITKMDPWHIVTLACLVESLDRRNIIVSLDRSEECGEYFFSGLKLGAYWKGKKDYTTADKSTVLNLWHIMPESTEDHARRTVEYLRNRFFKRKDLSSVTLSLLEAYYNINDHSKSDGNAFSMLSFDEDTEVLNVAVCDFGIGIAESVKDFDCTITDDKEALSKAIEAKFTVGSKAHNAGLGLLNIRNVCTEKDNLWIIVLIINLCHDSSQCILLTVVVRWDLLCLRQNHLVTLLVKKKNLLLPSLVNLTNYNLTDLFLIFVEQCIFLKLKDLRRKCLAKIQHCTTSERCEINLLRKVLAYLI